LSLILQEVQSDPGRKLEQWFYTDWLRSSWFQAMMARDDRRKPVSDATQNSQPPSTGSSTGSHNDVAVAEDEKANPNLLQPSFETPTPSFWSLDNPIVAAMVLISAGVALSRLFNFIKY